jgi:hypothetical protein
VNEQQKKKSGSLSISQTEEGLSLRKKIQKWSNIIQKINSDNNLNIK